MMTKNNFRTLFCVLLVAGLGSVSCTPEVPKLQVRPNGQESIVDEGNVEVFEPKMDILFVVDNSYSMDTHQSNLARNIDAFLGQLSKLSFLDYHIGVISTDFDCFDRSKPCRGALIGFPTYVERSTPNGERMLAANLRVGTDGSGEEKVFDPIYAAITPPLSNNANAGFYRKDATLALMLLTDAEDQSDMFNAQQLLLALKNLKSGTKTKVLSYGVIIPSTDEDCTRDDPGATPRRIEEFLGIVDNAGQNNTLNLCDPNFGPKLADIGQNLAAQVTDVIYLTRTPVNPDEIEVWFGTTRIPNDPRTGWTYDPYRNALVLGKDINWGTPPPGTKLQVKFEAVRR